MSRQESRTIVSILMESQLYLTLSIEERAALVTRLAECYPFLIEDDEEGEIGFDAD
jgi:hypothetical protein